MDDRHSVYFAGRQSGSAKRAISYKLANTLSFSICSHIIDG